MEFKTEKLTNSKVKFSFTVPAADFDKALHDAFLKNRSKISIPGFRKGKAPLSRIEAMYGKSIFYEDAFDLLFPQVYENALQESKVEPVSRPDVEVQKIGAGEDLEFTAEVYQYPEVKLGEYRGVEVTKYIHQVTEEEVEKRLAEEQKKQARVLTVTEGMIEPNDVLTFDYKGFVDGVAFENGEDHDAELKIGSGQFIPGFEDQLIGMELGTEGDIQVTFPKEYHSADLAGKDAVFHVNLKSCQREELPELDDEFAQDVSSFESLAEYKEDLARQLKEEAEKSAEERAKQATFDVVVKNAAFDLPAPMVEAQMDRMLERMDANMKKQGFSLDRFLQMIGNDKQAFREQYREQAAQEVSSQIVLEELVKAVDYQVTDEDINEFVDKAFGNESEEAKKFKEMLTDAQKENISYQVRNVKTIDYVWENAKLSTVEGDDPAAAQGVPDLLEDDDMHEEE